MEQEKQALIADMESQITKKIGDSVNDSRNMDKINLRNSYKGFSPKILETLAKNGCSSYVKIAEEILGTSEEEIRKSMAISRGTKSNSQITNKNKFINKDEIKDEIKDEENNEFKENTKTNLMNLTSEIDKNVTLAVNDQIDLVINNVLPEKLKKITDLISNSNRGLADHISKEFKRYLNNDVSEKIKNEYSDVTEKQNEKLLAEVDNILQDFTDKISNKNIDNIETEKETETETETIEQPKEQNAMFKNLNAGVESQDDQIKNYSDELTKADEKNIENIDIGLGI